MRKVVAIGETVFDIIFENGLPINANAGGAMLNSLITPEIRPQLLEIIKQAKERKSIIIYDPNFRKQHINELEKIMP